VNVVTRFADRVGAVAILLVATGLFVLADRLDAWRTRRLLQVRAHGCAAPLNQRRATDVSRVWPDDARLVVDADDDDATFI